MREARPSIDSCNCLTGMETMQIKDVHAKIASCIVLVLNLVSSY